MHSEKNFKFLEKFFWQNWKREEGICYVFFFLLISKIIFKCLSDLNYIVNKVNVFRNYDRSYIF